MVEKFAVEAVGDGKSVVAEQVESKADRLADVGHFGQLQFEIVVVVVAGKAKLTVVGLTGFVKLEIAVVVEPFGETKLEVVVVVVVLVG